MTTTTVLRAADGRRMPWKNGGGETVEIATHPSASGLDGIEWRVSLAAMTADGPFSAFPGLDRTLVVVQGEGIELRIGRQDPVRLDATSDPLGFAADAACTARLLSGPVTNLNVMTRRSRFRHAVTRLRVDEPTDMTATATTLLVCCAGTIAVGDRMLERHDCLLSEEFEALSLHPRGGPATGVLIKVLPV